MTPEVIPLGTASAIPTRDRHLAATALRRDGAMLLFDCGEGTQMQLVRAGLKRTKLEAIFITHFHGDHFYGLMGLLSTLALLERTEPLTVVGPERIEAIVRTLPGLANDWLPYEARFVEVPEDFEHEIVYDTDAFFVEARPVAHRIFTMGFRYEEKPRPGSLNVAQANALGVTDFAHYRALKVGEAVTLESGATVRPEQVIGPARPGSVFAYVMDTRPCENGVALARHADLLYHEATFGEAYAQNARDTGHSTACEAAEIAKAAGAKRLLLGHFSARYDDVAPLAEEAQAIFRNTEAAVELARYPLHPAPVPVD